MIKKFLSSVKLEEKSAGTRRCQQFFGLICPDGRPIEAQKSSSKLT